MTRLGDLLDFGQLFKAFGAERRRDSVPSGSVRTLDVGDGDKIGHENDVNRPYKAISSTSNDILS